MSADPRSPSTSSVTLPHGPTAEKIVAKRETRRVTEPDDEIAAMQTREDGEKDVTAADPEPGGQTVLAPRDGVPDGGYGWVVVFSYLAVSSVTWGINTTYGVYTAYYLEHNYFNGGSPFGYAWVGGTGVAIAVTSAPYVNWMVKRFGFRTPFVIGVLAASLSQIGAGLCHSFGAFLVCQGIVFGLGLGMTVTPVQPLIAHWFDRRLALVNGLSAAGSGLGALIWSNTTRVTLQKFGVKWSLIINGLISLVVLIPCIFLLRARYSSMNARVQPLEWKWLVHPGYVWVLLWTFFTMFGYFISIYSFAASATDGLGLSQTQGAALQSILAAGQMLGRPIIGLSLDRYGRINMVVLNYIVAGISCLAIWLPAKSFGVLVFFAIVQGFVGGTVWSSSAALTTQIVGVTDLGSALVWFWLIAAVPALVAQPIAISLTTYSQDTLGRQGISAYYISIGLAGGCYFVAAMLLYGSKVWKQGSWKVWQVI